MEDGDARSSMKKKSAEREPPSMSTPTPSADPQDDRGEEDIVAMQLSVERLRHHRDLVRRVHQENVKNREAMASLRKANGDLKQRLAQLSCEAIEREKQLRSRIVELEKELHSHRRDQEDVSSEMRHTVERLRENEMALRAELAQGSADAEEREGMYESEIKQAMKTVADLRTKLGVADDQITSLRKQLANRERDIDSKQKYMKQQMALKQQQLDGNYRRVKSCETEIKRLHGRISSLEDSNNKQSEALLSIELDLEDSQNGELLLQRTVEELQQTLAVAREQLEQAEETAKQFQTRAASATSRADQAERVLSELQLGKEISKIVESKVVKEPKRKCEDCIKVKARFDEYKLRMEKQVRRLTQHVKDLQEQLVAEMSTNQQLSKKLETEHRARKHMSEQRVQLLTEFYEEDNKLQHTLSLLKERSSPFRTSCSSDALTDESGETSPDDQGVVSSGVASKTTASSRAKRVNFTQASKENIARDGSPNSPKTKPARKVLQRHREPRWT